MSRQRYTYRTLIRELLFVCAGLAFLIPVFLLISGSLKTETEFSSKGPLALPSKLYLHNFSEAWSSGSPVSLSRSLVNSLIITSGSVLAAVIIGSLCAYIVSRRPSRFSSTVYVFFLLSVILPVQLAIVPLFVAMQHLGLVGNYLGMILLYTGVLMPLSVFFYTGFVRALPGDYEEAAQVDGASRTRIFLRVVFPLLRPVTGTVAILASIIVWNDFFTQLVFLSGGTKQTLPVAVYSFVGENEAQWNLIFAAVLVSVVPILLFAIVAQRQLIRGFTSGVRG